MFQPIYIGESTPLSADVGKPEVILRPDLPVVRLSTPFIFRRLLGYGRAFMASLSSTGMTTTANGVPASSLNCGSRLPNSLLPSIELS
jgi:hypothetical protein